MLHKISYTKFDLVSTSVKPIKLQETVITGEVFCKNIQWNLGLKKTMLKIKTAIKGKIVQILKKTDINAACAQSYNLDFRSHLKSFWCP